MTTEIKQIKYWWALREEVATGQCLFGGFARIEILGRVGFEGVAAVGRHRPFHRILQLNRKACYLLFGWFGVLGTAFHPFSGSVEYALWVSVVYCH